jgi:hypothetical protein
MFGFYTVTLCCDIMIVEAKFCTFCIRGGSLAHAVALPVLQNWRVEGGQRCGGYAS